VFLTDTQMDSLSTRFSKPRGAATGGEKSFGEILKTIETVGAGATMGYMNAKYCRPGRNAMEIGGVPVDLALGVVGNVVALSSYLGEYSEHAHNLANGLLCAYGVRLAMMWGADARIVQTRIQQQQASSAPNYVPRQMPAPPQTFSFPAPATTQPAQTQPAYDWAA
jgi:hypothetical protein